MALDAKTFDDILSDISTGMAASRAAEARGINRRELWALIGSDESAANKYTRAKQTGLEVWADEIVTISDDASGDRATRTNAAGDEYETLDTEFVARSKLRVESRKWLLAKLAPRKYGERQTIEHDASENFADVLVKARERARNGGAA